jgi:hypothetical protein
MRRWIRAVDTTRNQFDNCPFAPNTNQKDSVGNGIGDACRCGDVNNDGIVHSTDSVVFGRALIGLRPTFPWGRCQAS